MPYFQNSNKVRFSNYIKIALDKTVVSGEGIKNIVKEIPKILPTIPTEQYILKIPPTEFIDPFTPKVNELNSNIVKDIYNKKEEQKIKKEIKIKNKKKKENEINNHIKLNGEQINKIIETAKGKTGKGFVKF